MKPWTFRLWAVLLLACEVVALTQRIATGYYESYTYGIVEVLFALCFPIFFFVCGFQCAIDYQTDKKTHEQRTIEIAGPPAT